MKKLILTISLVGFTFGAFAQLGIDAGVNLSKYKYAAKLYLLPELSYTVKGIRFNVSWIFAEND